MKSGRGLPQSKTLSRRAGGQVFGMGDGGDSRFGAFGSWGFEAVVGLAAPDILKGNGAWFFENEDEDEDEVKTTLTNPVGVACSGQRSCEKGNHWGP
jgi:hypothetical protein